MEKSQICENIRKVKSKIEKTCWKIGRETSEVTLVAVSKTKPASYIREALECGQIEFGENRMQELEEKIPQFEPAQVSWHMIGNIQTNKIKLIADKISWVHSIEKLKYLKEFEKRSNGNKIKALIQVNISGEKQKGGVMLLMWEFKWLIRRLKFNFEKWTEGKILNTKKKSTTNPPLIIKLDFKLFRLSSNS